MWLDGLNLPLYQATELGQDSIQLIIELGCILFSTLVMVVFSVFEGCPAPVYRAGERA